MKKIPVARKASAVRTDSAPKTLIPALIAVGGGLAALPAAALELGDVRVNSSLGQPLRASIAYALAPNEALADTCVSLQRAPIGSDLPSVSRASISIANGIISITGQNVIREPLLSMRVNVRCPYTPKLSRDYMLFIDPAQPAAETTVTPAAAATLPRPAAAQARVALRPRAVSRAPIGNVSRYQVQPGDSLSVIAQRIENRPIGIWDAAAMIFDANPDAFIDADPNKLKAGSWLLVPDFGAAPPATVADSAVLPSANTQTAQSTSSTYPGVSATGSAAVDSSPSETVATNAAPAPLETTGSEAFDAANFAETNAAAADLRPGDVITDINNPFVTGGNETVVIPDTRLDAPEASSDSPNVPTATIQRPAPATRATNWLLWLVGGGLTIIAALVLFGRRTGNRFGSAPVGATATPQRRKGDQVSASSQIFAEPTIEVEEIPAIEDDSPTEENLALDADLAIGTGLAEGGDVDVAQDFGFAATTNLDLELPEEMSSGVHPLPDADVISPITTVEMQSLVDSEDFGDHEDEVDEYDMSVILDATKMPQPEDVTERDLEAIAVDTDDVKPATGDYTVSQEVDYKILEQDYEDEMTATQALNQEIARAAEELALRVNGSDDDETAKLSLASVTELDVEPQAPANNDDFGDFDDTGISETLATVNMSEDKTVEMVADDSTVEMPSEDNDATAEMTIKQGRAGSKRA